MNFLSSFFIYIHISYKSIHIKNKGESVFMKDVIIRKDKIENDELQSFAFIKENDTIKSFHSRSKESCLYMNINDDDDSILLAVRHFFFIKSNGSYISQKCESFFGCHCDQSLIYPNTFTIYSLLILELSD